MLGPVPGVLSSAQAWAPATFWWVQRLWGFFCFVFFLCLAFLPSLQGDCVYSMGSSTRAVRPQGRSLPASLSLSLLVCRMGHHFHLT